MRRKEERSKQGQTNKEAKQLLVDIHMSPCFHTVIPPDQSYAYDWGVGMGLHQDWGGPLLDYFVTALATLLLPIKQREEFLVALHIPLATGGEGDARQRWTFVDEDLEEVSQY